MALFLSPTFAIGFNKKTMRKSMITLNRKWIRLIGIVGCTMCLASCKQATDASGMKPSYATMKVEATDKELSTSYSATIRGRQDIDIYPQVSGTIEKLCVTEGQKVRRGQLLFIIDQVPYKAALKTAVANVEAARATLATAALTYNSNKELYAQKVVSEFSLKTARERLPYRQGTALAGRSPGDKRAQQPFLYGSEKSQRRSGGSTALPCGRIGKRQSAAAVDNGQ